MALTRYVLIAVELPVSLEVIERALGEAWQRYAENGSGNRRSRLLLVRARLAMARGRHREALADAQEGLERRRREPLGFSFSTHVRTLVDICLRLGDLELARRYIEEWESLDTGYPGTKRICLAAARSMILRRERRIDEALDWARRAEHEGRITDDLPSRFWVLKALIRALLCTDDPRLARGPLLDLLRLRNSAVGDIRYETRLLLADYHLANARRLAGLPPVDLELVGEVERPGSRASNETVLQQLHCARRLYGLALRTGRAIDRLLTCEVRTREVEQRLRLAGVIASATVSGEGAV
jgi:tetratricopeptide (TPR) repeat protein